MELSKELLEKAKAAKSAEELLTLAKENGVEMTESEAAEYFAQLHKSGELSDEELDNVAGGGCQAHGLAQVSNDLKVGDVFKYYRPEIGFGCYFQCYKCKNETFRVASIGDTFQHMVDGVCTKCGAHRSFHNYTEQDVYHKILK